MAGGAKLLGEGVAERGKGVGPRRVGEGGLGKGGGEGGGEGGWGEALIKVLNTQKDHSGRPLRVMNDKWFCIVLFTGRVINI